MTLAAPETVPPTVFAVAPNKNGHAVEGVAEVGGALWSVPMRLPSTTLPDVPLPSRSTPK